MRKSLLVTISTLDRLNDVKQLFSGVYFNGGWQGDYMLLAHDIPEAELKWFKDRGILVKSCQPVTDKEILYYHPSVIDKFYLFTPFFKKWDNIVYLDSDILVRASIEDLAKVKGFCAVHDGFSNLKALFINQKNKRGDIRKYIKRKKDLTELENNYENWNENCVNLASQLKKEYDLERTAFNTGVMAFSTDIIEENSFDKINELFEKYRIISPFADQTTLNLFLYRRWHQISSVYNVPFILFRDEKLVDPKNVKGAVIHLFNGGIPRKSQDPFYEEWMHNLKEADNIDLGNRIPAKKKWGYFLTQFYFLYLIIQQPRLFKWLFEMMFRNRFYYLYIFLKRCKNKIIKKA
jgi:lipopolysaccharide biosynthesis glycosyltransferase